MNVKAVAFDLDGTLIDSAPDIAVALNRALESQGLAQVASALSRSWIGDGPDRLIERALIHLRAEPTAALRDALRNEFDDATIAAPLTKRPGSARTPPLTPPPMCLPLITR